MKKLRRVLRKIAWVLTGLLIILVILHLPPVQNMIKNILEGAVNKKLDGKVVIEHLRFRLWRGDVVAKNLKLDTPGFSTRIPAVDISLFSSGGITIKADNPHIFLSSKPKKTKSPVKGQKQSPWWMLLKKVKLVKVQNAQKPKNWLEKQ